MSDHRASESCRRHRAGVLFAALAFAALETGSAAAAPESCVAGNIIVAGDFETTDPGTRANPNWSATSTVFGTPLCNLASCGSGSGTAAPRTGFFWSWFGGVPGATAETATLSQSVTFPSVATSIALNLYLWTSGVTEPYSDVLNLQVDGLTWQTYPEPGLNEFGYILRSTELTPLADGTSHTIRLQYVKGLGGGNANFNVDDVSLDVTCPPENIVFANGFESP